MSDTQEGIEAILGCGCILTFFFGSIICAGLAWRLFSWAAGL